MMFFSIRGIRVSLIFFIVLFVSTACVTGPVNIPSEMSAAELIQRGQEASDRNRYNQALQYYQALLDRNITNIDLVCAAEYEIAFIHYKQNKFTDARREFGSLLERYNTPDEELLPQQFKKLSNIVLERMDEKEKHLNNPLFFWRKKIT
jgi:outer membrane protein assembly factor BamD (BamD/ComL family)